MFDRAVGLALAPGGLLVSEAKEIGVVGGEQNQRIRRVAFDGTVTTVAGNGDAGYVDGPASRAEFDQPTGIWADSDGGAFIADSFNYRVRRLDASGVVSTFAGSGPVALPTDQGEFGFPPENVAITGNGSSNGEFAYPFTVIGNDQGYLFVGDAAAIESVNPSGTIGIVAGVPNAAAYRDGNPATARFNFLSALALSPSGLVVGDSTCLRLMSGTPSMLYADGMVSTLAGKCADSEGVNFQDGSGSQARFGAVTGLATDAYGNIYIADGPKARIRKASSQ